MNTEVRLQKHLSPLGAWAYTIGVAMGWGGFMLHGSIYLLTAGLKGSILCLLTGAALMLLMSWNYSYLMQCYPDCGGAYTFAREVFGNEYGYLAACFLMMVNLPILWSNMTSLVLFDDLFQTRFFHFGRLYSFLGDEIYLGEILITLLVVFLAGLCAARWQKLADRLMIGFAIVLCACLCACVLGSLFKGASVVATDMPLEMDGTALRHLIRNALLSSWAFIGLGGISHLGQELDFDHKRIPRVLLACGLTIMALFLSVLWLTRKVYPPRYDSWLAYVRDLRNLTGLESSPLFYAVWRCLGSAGCALLALGLLSIILGGVLGCMVVLSRFFYSLALYKILPQRFAALSARGIPARALWLAVLLCLPMVFLGRTLVEWNAGLIGVGGLFTYGIVSAAACQKAKEEKRGAERMTGFCGTCLTLFLFGILLLPNLLNKGILATESYFLMVVWGVSCLLYYYLLIRRDKDKRFIGSMFVRMALITFALLFSFLWMRQSMITSKERMVENIREYFEQRREEREEATASQAQGEALEEPGREEPDFVPGGEGSENTKSATEPTRQIESVFLEAEAFVLEQVRKAEGTDTRTSLVTLILFIAALSVMFLNQVYLYRSSKERDLLVNRDPLTGVKSRHAYQLLEKKFNQEIAAKTAGEFAVVVCDAYGVKKVNDANGAKAGDEYICAASALICEIFDHSPVFRTGGDEFVVFLSGRDYANRKELLMNLHDTCVDHIHEDKVVVAAGLSDYAPGTDGTVRDVYGRADTLMRREKQLLKGVAAANRNSSLMDLLSAQNDSTSIINVKHHILVADDEYTNRMLLGSMLSDFYEVIYAEDGVEALNLIEERKHDIALILLDLVMPGLGGMDVLRTLKMDAELKNIPVIVLTAEQSAEVECLNVGAIDFIPKPYPKREIVLARVSKCIELFEDRALIQSTERDILTQLFNIDYFCRYVRLFDKQYWEVSMDAIVIDINHFHMLNERFGKEYGDHILRRLGERLRQLARKVGGVCGRKGGDTFLLYCPHQEDYEEMVSLISKGLDDDESAENRVRLRMGVYSNVDKKLEIERRFDRAKVASDAVKINPMKSVGIYDDKMHELDLFKERLLDDFQTAIDEKQFVVFYQPKFDIRPQTPMLSSAEALVRWKHPELDMISPTIFIPLLEESGLILNLDIYVWTTVAADIRKWKERFGFCVPVSVNVSRIDMLTPNLKDIFMNIVHTYELGINDLVLEITESAYIGDTEQVISAANELRAMGMGFRIEMDDFGTGYSSLGMLTNLPIDALKMDMTFVRNAFGKAKDVRMLELIIDIADYLHVPVVAEGVETEEQLLVLKAMGCDLVQGYYFSKPIPHDEFDRFLIERSKVREEVPEIKKTYVSIHKALTTDYENLYYIDMHSDLYLEFFAGSGGRLQIRPGERGFFQDMDKNLLDDVYEEDRDKIKAILQKENLKKWKIQEDPLIGHYRKLVNNELKKYSLQIIHTRNSDDSHIVIGVRCEEKRSVQEPSLKEEKGLAVTKETITNLAGKAREAVSLPDQPKEAVSLPDQPKEAVSLPDQGPDRNER